ncbi:MAG: hypothetical protein HUU35_18910, partial [Armatimonadetes bacterium]|nr:hypothetical protein [Armatimonadota bacterium]
MVALLSPATVLPAAGLVALLLLVTGLALRQPASPRPAVIELGPSLALLALALALALVRPPFGAAGV